MVRDSRPNRSLSALRSIRLKSRRMVPLIGKPSPRKYLAIRNEGVLHRGHGRALRAGERMQARAIRAFQKGTISRHEYFRIRRAIEKKQVSLLDRIAAQSIRLSERDTKFGMLYNAKKAKELCVDLLKQNGLASFVIVDVDHFKQINDRYGHDVGDIALRFLASISNQVARKMGGFVGRYGGEEFLVGLPGGRARGIQFVRRLNKELLAEFRRNETVRSALNGNLYTFSSGIAEKGERNGFEQLFRLADERLYRSKQSNRNRLTFSNAPPRVIRK